MIKDEALKLALDFIENSEGGTADLEAHINSEEWTPEDTAHRVGGLPMAQYGVGAELSNQPFVHYAKAIESKIKEKNT